MQKAPQPNSCLHRGETLSDGVTDVDTLASSEGTIAKSVWNLFEGNAPLDSTQTDAAGVSIPTIDRSTGSAPGSATPATASSGDIGASLAALDVHAAPAVTIANGATVEINSASESVTFAGTTGTLKIGDSLAFAGHVSGLSGSDALDLADVSYGANTTASFSGNAHGGTLTISDGTDIAHVGLLGDYLTSGWTLSSDGKGGTVVVDPPMAMPGDGSANGPGGAPQFANILSGYTVRPSWQVAGVDYAVGITPGTALKDPATINMAGVTVDAKDHQIIVTAANVTLDGYDFSLAGGWGVDTQAANTTISNSNFKIGSNGNFTIYGDTGSSNLTVKDCVIDGNYQSDNLNNGLIYTSTPGLTVEYTLVEHGYSDFIQAQDGGQITLKYNVLNNNGNVNAHPDWLQTMGTASSPFTETIEYNTVYMTPNANDAGTQGFMLNDNGSTLSSAEFAYNTIVALPGTNVSPITTLVGSNITGTATVHDNFVDSRGGSYGSESFFADPAYSANAMYYNNTNMSTGGLYYQNVATSPTAPIAGQVNALIASVATDPTMVPSVVITSDTVNGNIVTLEGTANSSENFAYSTVQIFDGSTQIGLAKSNAAGAWSFTTGTLAAGTHSFTAIANNYFGYHSPVSAAVPQTISGTIGTAPPAAPTIASFSTDSGVVGDHITNDSTPTLTGAAAANSTVKVFDGTTQVGTTTADSSGAWTLTTSKLAEGSHGLTATDTVAGMTSAASSALTVTVDTVAPNAPVETGASIISGTTEVQLTGTAESNSTLQVFDGTSRIGTATANSSGAWGLTTGALASGGHSFTAKATDAAGNTSMPSATLAVTVPSAPTAPAAPTIALFSTDSGVVGDHITNDSTPTLTGAAAANSTVKVFDGTTQVGAATADSSGAWTLTTSKLAEGSHGLTATDTVAGMTSAASSALTVTVDTVAPNAPVETGASIISGTTEVQLTGTAESNSTLQVFDGTSRIGTATANSSGAWGLTTGALASGGHSFTAKATDAAGNTSMPSATLAVTVPSAPTAPAAPTIALFSTDSGVVGDHITNDSTPTLTGAAAANSTVKVFDGTTQVGTTTADSSGAWTLTTSKLAEGSHGLTATDTVAGMTSAASSALTVTVDTVAPNAPVLISNSVVNTNHVLLSGTAAANSAIAVYDGTTAVGITTTGANGTWSVTTAALASGTQALTATATDGAGNTSVLSQALDPIIGSPALAAPMIASFSTDSGVVGDHITNDSTPTLSGAAAANSTVKVFDGTTQVGTTTANSSGQWTLTTSTLSDGVHSLTAIDTNSSDHTSSPSSAFAVTIDTHAPGTPTMAVYSLAGSAVGSVTTIADVLLKGTAEANSTVDVFDSGNQIGVASANSGGAWSFDTGNIANGSHSFTSKAVDVAGNTSAASAADAVTVNAPLSDVDFTNMHLNKNHTLTIKGTADAHSQIKLYDGNTSLGTPTAAADGTWSFKTSSNLSNTVHTLTARELDSTGHVVASSGSAILGSTGNNTLSSTAGNDLFVGKGGADTFVFAANFGNDVIKDFVAGGSRHDVVQFSTSVFDSFASVLAHATQVGQDVVISVDASDSLTLKNSKLSALHSHDFHFA